MQVKDEIRIGQEQKRLGANAGPINPRPSNYTIHEESDEDRRSSFYNKPGSNAASEVGGAVDRAEDISEDEFQLEGE